MYKDINLCHADNGYKLSYRQKTKRENDGPYDESFHEHREEVFKHGEEGSMMKRFMELGGKHEPQAAM